ncbi:hypothetical protein IAU59_000892 [Kwoniella sp. CBS 9459]
MDLGSQSSYDMPSHPVEARQVDHNPAPAGSTSRVHLSILAVSTPAFSTVDCFGRTRSHFSPPTSPCSSTASSELAATATSTSTTTEDTISDKAYRDRLVEKYRTPSPYPSSTPGPPTTTLVRPGSRRALSSTMTTITEEDQGVVHLSQGL